MMPPRIELPADEESRKAALSHLLNKIDIIRIKSLFFQDADVLHDAVQHVTSVLRPGGRLEPPSEELLQAARMYKQRVDAAIYEYANGGDYAHYYDYILDIAYEMKFDDSNEALCAIFDRHGSTLKDKQLARRRGKKKRDLNEWNKRVRELARQHALSAVGHTDQSPSDVYCFDAVTHEKLDAREVLFSDVGEAGDRAQRATSAPHAMDETTDSRASATTDLSTPLPADENPFGTGFVDPETVRRTKGMKILHKGSVYGFARAPNGAYSMVFAAQFSPLDSFDGTTRQAVDTFADFVPKAAKHAFEVKGNRAQNAEAVRQGHLYSAGWRPGRTPGECFGEYTAQSERDKHNPDGYIDLYECQEPVNVAWMILQERLSPRAVMRTVETLADTAVPLFGSHDNDISTHGPSLGSNMAVSRHGKDGRGFANGMHIDRDLDSLPQYYGKLFTFGQWLHTNRDGDIAAGECIKKAIPDGLFVLPGYKVAFDIGAASVVTAIWRGGMDVHGTTTSRVNLEHGITRWGMSIQTNRNLPSRMRSNKGEIFGIYDRLRAFYDVFTAGQ